MREARHKTVKHLYKKERDLAVSRRLRSRENSALQCGGRGCKGGPPHDVQRKQRSRENSALERGGRGSKRGPPHDVQRKQRSREKSVLEHRGRGSKRGTLHCDDNVQRRQRTKEKNDFEGGGREIRLGVLLYDSKGPTRRETRLMQLRASQQERLANETHEVRETRLMQLSMSQQERLANESHEDREARILKLNTACKTRQSYESPQDRETRLSQDRERYRVQQPLRVQLPLLNERSFQTTVSKFHEHMSSLSVSKCSVCMEQFPGLQLCCNATECVRCSCDNGSPKLYSSGNNMDPGSQPLELQVSILYA